MYVRLDVEDLWCGRAKFNDFVQKRKFDQKALAISYTSNVMLLFGPAMHARLDVEDL